MEGESLEKKIVSMLDKKTYREAVEILQSCLRILGECPIDCVWILNPPKAQ